MEKPTLPDLAADSEAKPKARLTATPLRCFTGALTAGTFSLLAYRLTLSVATTFANKPVTSDNPAVVNISAAVRTLVTGIVALGAGVFGIAALGLAALGIQLLFKSVRSAATETDTAKNPEP
ncbi:DUF3082 domain-containing protein [Leptolyngbya sp. BC1307]|uniref:DUF3082 domain-containing protein n=1 Tax=Leptolyngbya sp. BC1307 TaxID=2029589 RepID=UPI000EFBA199|nr:DUF3082 domain-containing protein [Leptolyngbya sp. BC1307]